MKVLRALSAIALVGTTAGCGLMGLGGKLPPREFYRLTPPDSAFAGSSVDGVPGRGAAGPSALDGTLAILAYETPGLYGESGIVFRIGDVSYGAYPSREWALPLGEMLGQLTAQLGEGAGLTRDVPLYAPSSPRAHAYIWRGRVRQFEEVNRGGRVLVAVHVDAAIVRTRDDSVVWSGSLGRERPVAGGGDMPQVVRALSSAGAEVIAELLQRAARDLGRTAVGRRLPGDASPADTARRTP